MPDYNASRATAVRLIGKFGSNRKVTLLRRGEASYDPVTDTETGPSEAAYEVVGVTAPSGEGMATPGDSNAVGGPATLYLPATGLPVQPLPGDRVLLPPDAAPWAITAVKTMAPDGDAIYHTCAIQRGGGA